MTRFQKIVLSLLGLIACVVFALAGTVGAILIKQSVAAAPVTLLSNAAPSTTPTSTTDLPISTPKQLSGPFSNIEQLVANIAGPHIVDQIFTVYEDGGYDVDIAVRNPNNVSRREMLFLAYDLQRAFHYSFSANEAPYMALHVRPGSLDEMCAFGVGIGRESAPRYLPKETPEDLEAWYRGLRESGYYADRPGEKIERMAYANDPAYKPRCGNSSK